MWEPSTGMARRTAVEAVEVVVRTAAAPASASPLPPEAATAATTNAATALATVSPPAVETSSANYSMSQMMLPTTTCQPFLLLTFWIHC